MAPQNIRHPYLLSDRLLDYEGTAKTIDADQIAGALIQLISLPNVHINHLNRVAQAIT